MDKRDYDIYRIMRMQKKGKKRGGFQIRGHIDKELTDIMFHLKPYQKSGDRKHTSMDTISAYEESGENKAVVRSIFCMVNLEYSAEENTYMIIDNIDDDIQKLFIAVCPRSPSRSSNSSLFSLRSTQHQSTVERQGMSDDGRRRTLVLPN